MFIETIIPGAMPKDSLFELEAMYAFEEGRIHLKLSELLKND